MPQGDRNDQSNNDVPFNLDLCDCNFGVIIVPRYNKNVEKIIGVLSGDELFEKLRGEINYNS